MLCFSCAALGGARNKNTMLINSTSTSLLATSTHEVCAYTTNLIGYLQSSECTTTYKYITEISTTTYTSAVGINSGFTNGETVLSVFSFLIFTVLCWSFFTLKFRYIKIKT